MTICPNTSPLLILGRIDRLDLLGDPHTIVITEPVLTEVRDKLDTTTQRVDQLAAQVRVVAATVPGHVDFSHNLGPGERSVLAWVVSAGPEACCVLDDAAARVEARRLGLALTGTLGLVLRAKLQGTLSAAAPLLAQAVDAGLYLDDAVLAAALARVGERWRTE